MAKKKKEKNKKKEKTSGKAGKKEDKKQKPEKKQEKKAKKENKNKSDKKKEEKGKTTSKKPKKEEKNQEKPSEKKEEEEINQIVRIAEKDLNGNQHIARALTEVKGIDFTMAQAIAKKAAKELSIDTRTKLGVLTEEQTKKLTEIVENPRQHGIPYYLLNRRKDRKTGKNLHITGHELDFKIKEDIGLERKIRSYKGVRHQLGLTVRGQRTRTSGRSGTTVGVKKTDRMKKAQKR